VDGYNFNISDNWLSNREIDPKAELKSHTDFLTGLWNRRYLFLRLEEEMARDRQEEKSTLCCDD
jgi:GGDEF domain-containing protein